MSLDARVRLHVQSLSEVVARSQSGAISSRACRASVRSGSKARTRCHATTAAGVSLGRTRTQDGTEPPLGHGGRVGAVGRPGGFRRHRSGAQVSREEPARGRERRRSGRSATVRGRGRKESTAEGDTVHCQIYPKPNLGAYCPGPNRIGSEPRSGHDAVGAFDGSAFTVRSQGAAIPLRRSSRTIDGGTRATYASGPRGRSLGGESRVSSGLAPSPLTARSPSVEPPQFDRTGTLRGPIRIVRTLRGQSPRGPQRRLRISPANSRGDGA